jgi:GGDEF domain-containing protein
MKIAERIKDKIREIFEGKLSISYGVESISPDIINYEEVIKRADTKMYAHKVSKF